jgi:hypothetical protein
MDDMMKRLQERAAVKTANTAPKAAFKTVHPKQRMARNKKIKQVVDQATVDDIFRWLDEDETGYIGVGLIIGRIAGWKMEDPNRQLSKDHEQILRLVKVLYDQVKALSSVE